MLFILIILVVIVAAVWGYFWILPSQRHLLRFVYGAADSPDRLNGGFRGDDVTQKFAGDPPQWPSVTVIVPGRNEGHILAKTLGSLCGMDYPNFRVVFVDDQSTDKTAEMCRELEGKYTNLKVIHNEEGPRDGWVGKTWAIHQAAAEMNNGDYLLFTDSDLEFHPQCLKHMVRLALHRNSDVTSLLPALRYKSFGERLGLVSTMTIINTKLSLYRCNNPKDPRSLVAGGFLLIKREVYHALGGHEAVRGQVVEDIALGTRAKSLGHRVFTALTHDLYTARMYEGWGDTYRGLKKNAYAGANYSPAFAAVIAVFLLFFGALTPLYVLVACYLWITLPSLMTFAFAVMSILALSAQIAVGTQTARYAGWPDRMAMLLPAGMAFYFLVFVGSVIDHSRGGNMWAGRQIVKPQSLSNASDSDKNIS